MNTLYDKPLLQSTFNLSDCFKVYRIYQPTSFGYFDYFKKKNVGCTFENMIQKNFWL